MINILNKIFNWFFGSFFRTMGRILFYVLFGFLIYILFSKYGLNVKADTIYNLNYDSALFKFAVKGMSMPVSENLCYTGEEPSVSNTFLKPLSVPTEEGVLQLNGMKGGFKTSDIFKNDPDTFKKNFFRLEFSLYKSSDLGAITSIGRTYNYSVLVSSSIPLLLNSNGWTGSTKWYYNQGWSSEDYWYDSHSNATYTILNNGSNMYWITFTFTVPSTWNKAPQGILFDFYIPNTANIWCKNNDNMYFGEPNWFYINNAIFQDSNMDNTLLVFPTENVNNNYWSNDDYLNPDNGSTDPTTPPSDTDKIDDSINNMNDNIMDPSIPDISGLEDAPGWLPPGPLDSVINLPINILNNLNNQLNGTCKPFTFTIPFINKSLSIPCISDLFNKIKGLGVFLDFIGTIAGGLLMYNYLVYLYNWVDDITSLKHFKARMFGAKSDVENWAGVD